MYLQGGNPEVGDDCLKYPPWTIWSKSPSFYSHRRLAEQSLLCLKNSPCQLQWAPPPKGCSVGRTSEFMHFTADPVQGAGGYCFWEANVYSSALPAPVRSTEQMLFSWCFYTPLDFLLLFQISTTFGSSSVTATYTLSGHQDCYSDSPLCIMS